MRLLFTLLLLPLLLLMGAALAEASSSSSTSPSSSSGNACKSCGRIKVTAHHSRPLGVDLSIIGDVNDVINGVVPEGSDSTWYKAQHFLFGLGAASPRSMQSLGEAFMYNGGEYTLGTDPTDDNYFETITGRQYLATFSIGLSREDNNPDLTMRFRAAKHRHSRKPRGTFRLHDMYTRLNKELNENPFCYYGLFRFKNLHSVSVSKAPIYGENIFEHANEYYSQPAFELRNVMAVTAGCAANFSNIENPNLRKQLSRALYVNPLDETTMDNALNVHSHAMSIKGRFEKDLAANMDLDSVTPDMVDGVYHMLSHSEIDQFTLHAYQINGIRDITNDMNEKQHT